MILKILTAHTGGAGGLLYNAGLAEALEQKSVYGKVTRLAGVIQRIIDMGVVYGHGAIL